MDKLREELREAQADVKSLRRRNGVLKGVENQAQHRLNETAEPVVGRIGVNQFRPVRTTPAEPIVGRIDMNRLRPVRPNPVRIQVNE
jgi:hypothetical protein